MKKFARVCTIVAALCASSAYAGTQAFDGLSSFGDSLSDIGNESAAPITTPGGSTWVYYLGQKLGFNITASNNGGTDYAFAGAVSGALPYTPSYTTSSAPPTVISQVQSYLAARNGRADSHTIYTIVGGANDLGNTSAGGYFANGNIIQHQTITALGLALVNQGTNNIVQAANTLQQAGAQYIIVGNIPNLYNTPKGKSEIDAAIANINAIRTNPLYNLPPLTPAEEASFRNSSQTYDTELLAKLNASGLNVIQLDTFNLLNALQDNYQLFNFYGPQSTYSQNLDPSRVIFADDGFHPGAEAQLIDAQYAFEVLQGPQYAAILASAPFAVMDSQNSAIQSQLSPLEQGFSNVLPCKFSTFATGDYQTNNIKQNGNIMPGYHANFKAFTVGGAYRFNQNLMTGFAVGRSMDNLHYAHHAGGFDMDENLVTAFTGYQWQNFYGNVEASYGNIDYNNIHRNFDLGVVHETVTGRTTGYQFGANGLIGYNMDFNTIKTGPVASLDWQEITVKPYSENSKYFHQTPNNGAFDALQYYRQTNNSFLGALGWQINTQIPVSKVKMMPYLQATFDHQFNDQDRNVAAGVTTLPGSKFKMPVTAPDGNFGLITTGIQTQFNSGLLLGFGYSTMVGESHKYSQNFMINASMPL